MQGHTDYVFTVAVTEDDKYIISGTDDKTIRIWNLLEKRQESVLEGNTDSIKCVAVTSDYKYFVSGSVDKTIRVWNLLKKDKQMCWKDI